MVAVLVILSLSPFEKGTILKPTIAPFKRGDSMKEKRKNMLRFTLPVAVLLAASGVLYWLLVYRKYGALVGLRIAEIAGVDFLWCGGALLCALFITFVFLRCAPMEKMYDPNVRYLADLFSLKFLAVYFIPNAFYEELIFRGVLQMTIGLLPAAILFTLVHISYYKKPLMLLETFFQALVLGILFELTGSLWITTLSHMLFNTLQMWLIKTDRVPYCMPGES